MRRRGGGGGGRERSELKMWTCPPYTHVDTVLNGSY